MLPLVAALKDQLEGDCAVKRAARWRLDFTMERRVVQQHMWEPAHSIPTPARNLGPTTRAAPTCWETLACAALLHPAVRGGTWLEDQTKQTLQARLVRFCRSFHPGGSVADREEEEAAAPAIPATVEKKRRSRGDAVEGRPVKKRHMSSSTAQPTEPGDKDAEDVERGGGGPDDRSAVASVASRKTRRGGKEATALLRGSLDKVVGRAAGGTASGWMWTQSEA